MKPNTQATLLATMAMLTGASTFDRPLPLRGSGKVKSMDPNYRTGNRSRKAKRKAQKAARRKNR